MHNNILIVFIKYFVFYIYIYIYNKYFHILYLMFIEQSILCFLGQLYNNNLCFVKGFTLDSFFQSLEKIW